MAIFKRNGFEIKYGGTHRKAERIGTTDSLMIYIKGMVANDELNGEAEVTLSNGDYYIGTFEKRKLTYSNGVSEEGTFMYGTCVNGVRKNKRGAVIGRIR